MIAKCCILGYMLDDNSSVALADFVANRCLKLKFAPRIQAERDFVAHRATNPSIICNPCNGSEAHAGGTANNFKDARHRLDTPYGVDVPAKSFAITN
jgi:hypothetical protein